MTEPTIDLLVGDVREQLATLPAESVHCVVTSPPFWGLRDYGTASWEGGDPGCAHRVGGQVEDSKAKGAITAGVRPGVDASTCLDCGAQRVDAQIGLEPTPEAYVESIVEVFRAIHRVLRSDGTAWLNLGDSYASKQRGSDVGWAKSRLTNPGTVQKAQAAALRDIGERHRGKGAGLKEKDLVLIPARVALALQEDGWHLRADVVEEVELYCPCGCGFVLEERIWRHSPDREIIWAKPNPMPESVTDRPTKSHEHLFLLSKSRRYFFDADAVREPYKYDGRNVLTRDPGPHSHENHQGMSRDRWPGLKPRRSGNLERKHGADVGAPGGTEGDLGRSIPWEEDGRGRNLRSVWTIATRPYPDAHFATFPPALVEPCVKAGTSERGCCPDCGAPWLRAVEKGPPAPEPSHRQPAKRLEPGQAGNVDAGNMGFRASRLSGQEMQRWRAANPDQQLGWRPSCGCYDPLYESDFPKPRGRWQRMTWLARAKRRPVPFPWPTVPAVILDPFAGSGTTLIVARRLGRSSVGVELNPEYAEKLVLPRLERWWADPSPARGDQVDGQLDLLSEAVT